MSSPASSPDAQPSVRTTSFYTALLSGALAGTTVDLTLYPLDTLKTRLQSPTTFLSSGGFSGIYAGVGSAIVGSAPGAALFFCTYEGTKSFLSSRRNALAASEQDQVKWAPLEHMAAASLGEVAACAVRVPTEVVKQRAQARQYPSSMSALSSILSQRSKIGFRGVWREMYRGWSITIFREVPFTVIQFPLWEAMKARRLRDTGRSHVRGDSNTESSITATESAILGSASGAVAAAFTTPLDVLKTRMMLSTQKVPMSVLFKQILHQNGPRAFFAGIGPRIGWISAGGFIFLGSYQWAHNKLEELSRKKLNEVSIL